MSRRAAHLQIFCVLFRSPPAHGAGWDRNVVSGRHRNSALAVLPRGVLLVHPCQRRFPMTAMPTKSVSQLLGVPPAPKTGRDRLVMAAVELFYRRGFGAV